MRTLYLPTNGRATSRAEAEASWLLQDNIHTDQNSATYWVLNTLVGELERAGGLFAKMDMRPWQADVRATGSLVPIDPDTKPEEKPYNELLYGVPDRWKLRDLRTYDWDPAEGTVVRAIEATDDTGDFLIVETAANRLIKVTPSEGGTKYEYIDPDLQGLFGANASRWALTSLDEWNYTVFEGKPEEEVPISITVEGFNILVEARGRFKIDLRFSARAPITTGDDLSALPYFEEAAYLYDDVTGERIVYTLAGDTITFGVGGDTGSLHYTGLITFNYTSPKGSNLIQKVSFTDATPYMYRLPDDDRIDAYQITDILAYLPGPGPRGRVAVDAKGFVGETAVGHEISLVLPSDFHTVVGHGTVKGTDISLVEHDTGEVVLKFYDPNLDAVGITWTADGALGLIDHPDSTTLTVYALDDVRPWRTGQYTTP